MAAPFFLSSGSASQGLADPILANILPRPSARRSAAAIHRDALEPFGLARNEAPTSKQTQNTGALS